MARTQNSIRNVLSAMVGQLGGILVNLLARVFFLHYLNQTYLGLNGLFTNVLTMLSLKPYILRRFSTWGHAIQPV